MSDGEDARDETGDNRSNNPREEGFEGAGKGAKNHKKYRKDKPWDNPSIDHWTIPEWKDDTMKVISIVVSQSSLPCFATI